MAEFWDLLALSTGQCAGLAAICFVAGLVRGFTGFALSAFALSLAALILPPVKLIPLMWWLEMAASVLMVRGGMREADNRVAVILVVGAVMGLIAGLYLTTTLNPDLSRRIALVLLITLATLQLIKVRIRHLNNTGGTVAAGLVSGIVTGLAGIGGMVVALFVLARDDSPRVMRATLVMYLFLGSLTSMALHLWFGTMNTEATLRGLTFSIPCMIGVVLGQKLFIPSLQPYYRPVCLSLLMGLAALSLARSVI